MPGMTGIIGRAALAAAHGSVEPMVRCMLHEKFYNSGTYVNEQMGVGVGWVCHKESFADCMPVWNERKDICLIFSGEVHPDEAELDCLRARGCRFDSNRASYLVWLYEQNGLGFLTGLNGWFSGLIIDIREQKIVLFNDRYGFNRIYCHERAEGFYFSSEAKSLLKVLPDLRRLDYPSVGETVSCGCVLQSRTLFAGVSLLPGASRWTFRPDRAVAKETYFNKSDWENQPRLTGHEYYEKLNETFPGVLRKYLNGNVRTGMSLTGGLDGRMIMAWTTCPPETLPCYTFGGGYRDCTDVAVARQVAKACGQPHQVIPVDGQFLREFSTLAEKVVYVSDGAMDVSGSAELYVNRIAREIAPVRLTGNYGSEILRGNVAFKPGSAKAGVFDSGFERLVNTAHQTYQEEAHCHPLTFIAFKQVPWHHYSRLSVEQSQLTLRSPYLDNDLVSLMYQAPPNLAASTQPSFRLIADGNPALSRIPTDRGGLYRPIPVLTKFRNIYQEFTIRAEYAYDYGMPQWLARIDHVFAPFHLEKLFLGRHKFCHFRVWYRDALSRYLKEMLLDSRARGRPYLQGNRLERMVIDHTAGRGNHTSELHQVLTLELIQRTLIEQK